MIPESPELLLADVNEAAAFLAAGLPHLAKAVLQLRDLVPRLNLALEATTRLAETAARERQTEDME